MGNTCAYGTGCWLTSVGIFLGWWLLASALLWLTWNRVIGGIAKVKSVKYWQALVFVSTLCVFMAPRWYMMKACHARGESYSHTKNCKHGDGERAKGDCPYANSHENVEKN